MRTLLLAVALGTTTLVQAQQQPSVTAQREAMKKLNFLVGRWSGEAAVARGPGEPLKITQTEDVQYKMDGLILLVEGTGHAADGRIVFRALATVAYDDSTSTYRFRAYNDGHYLDTDLTVVPNGFAWGFTAGPAKITNTMHLTDKGEWAETTEAVMGSTPPRKSVEMLLQHQL
jgi:hypothetical protein